MTQQQIIRFIDQYLEDHAAFMSGQMVDFALDVRSFVTQLDRERELVEAA